MIKKLTDAITKKEKRVLYLSILGFYNKMDDEKYLKIQFKNIFGHELDLKAPQTFNEKLQWLKIYDRNPLYTTLVDKYEVKEYVSKKIGDEYIIKTLGVWDKFDEIDIDSLPNQFVLKCTHDSGGVVICKDKTNFDLRKARKKIEKSLKRNYYLQNREWIYKNVKPRIIAEEYMEDTKTGELRDYKFFCFNGKVQCFKVDFDRFNNHKANYYDRNKQPLYFGEVVCPPDYGKEIEMPNNLEKMIDFAEQLSKDTIFVRVDFYNTNGRIFFGEMTFFPASGFGKFTSDEWDKKLGEWIQLTKN